MLQSKDGQLKLYPIKLKRCSKLEREYLKAEFPVWTWNNETFIFKKYFFLTNGVFFVLKLLIDAFSKVFLAILILHGWVFH